MTNSQTAQGSNGTPANLTMYMVTPRRFVRLTKQVTFYLLPRVNEFIKVKNRKMGDYFAFLIVQVTHKEDGIPELWIHASSFVNGRSQVSFWPEEELDGWIAGYENEGWVLKSDVENRVFRENDGSMLLRFSGIT